MDSSQESDVSFATIPELDYDTELSSQESIALENDGWKDGEMVSEFGDFDNSSVGPNQDLDDDSDAAEYFKLFWNDHLTELTINETNR